MAIVDLDLWSGYEANRKQLDRLVEDPSNELSFYEARDQNLILYVSEVSLCSGVPT